MALVGKNKIQIAVGIIILFLIIFFLIVLQSGSRTQEFSLPKYYSNSVEFSQKDLAILMFSKINSRGDSVSAQLKVHEYRVEEVDPKNFIAEEKLVKEERDEIFKDITYYRNSNGTKILTKNNAEKKFLFSNNDGNSDFTSTCTDTTSSFATSLFGSIASTFLIKNEKITNSECMVTVAQQVEGGEVRGTEYRPLCTLMYTNQKLVSADCSYEIITSVGSQSYDTTSLLNSLQVFVNTRSDYGVIVGHEIFCESEGCAEVEKVNTRILPKEITIDSVKIVYIPHAQNDKKYLIPHYEIMARGDVISETPSSQSVPIPTTYQIIIPAIQFRYFKK